MYDENIVHLWKGLQRLISLCRLVDIMRDYFYSVQYSDNTFLKIQITLLFCKGVNPFI